MTGKINGSCPTAALDDQTSTPRVDEWVKIDREGGTVFLRDEVGDFGFSDDPFS